jgi:hypothetical protein
MATARTRATRHLIECLRNCLRGEAAGALLTVVEKQVARLLGGHDDWDDYDDWPDLEGRKRAGAEDASPAARAARRAPPRSPRSTGPGRRSAAPRRTGTGRRGRIPRALRSA